MSCPMSNDNNRVHDYLLDLPVCVDLDSVPTENIIVKQRCIMKLSWKYKPIASLDV